ncbi:MAG: DUF2785 domain-containing protein, partial [Dokdonella sp.]
MQKTLIVLLLIFTSSVFGACPPQGQTRQSLQALKATKFVMTDPVARTALAQDLLDCLSDPDPVMRDGIAYSALAEWMRADDFDAATLRTMRDALYTQLDRRDEIGFGRPFAALVLSEVARTDRIRAWMTPGERAAMVEKAANYVAAVRDYRGFDDKQGWRHGVAHGADWLMQLAMNPALSRSDTDRILTA